MKFEVTNRFSGVVQFTAEIDCDEDKSRRFKLGLAVKWAIKNDADLRGAYLGGADLRGADLRGAYLRGAYLGDADLGGADLRGAYLRDADLRDADLGGADLRGAYLRGAYLGGADLGDADLRGAYLRGAYLGGADLRGADLRGADLGGAYLRGAYLGDADLGGLKIVQGPIRQDGYQYILYTSALGGCVIKAGCRTWVGDCAINEAYEHCASVTGKEHSAQATRIIDYLAGELSAIRELDAFQPKLEVAA